MSFAAFVQRSSQQLIARMPRINVTEVKVIEVSGKESLENYLKVNAPTGQGYCLVGKLKQLSYVELPKKYLTVPRPSPIWRYKQRSVIS